MSRKQVAYLYPYDKRVGINLTPFVKKIFRKPIIFHEVLEADLFYCQDMQKHLAHKIARKHELRFAKEILTPEGFNEYILLFPKDDLEGLLRED